MRFIFVSSVYVLYYVYNYSKCTQFYLVNGDSKYILFDDFIDRQTMGVQALTSAAQQHKKSKGKKHRKQEEEDAIVVMRGKKDAASGRCVSFFIYNVFCSPLFLNKCI